ncbi:hypothetical protein [Sulfuricurvum sp.]|uniref:hypothetical protein n=1 Tax=Sulfuricurvum sp. TaxID=2025608 RepID=UPI00286DD005|nr:hypothetical protein [Sulfuricurvum sp.]
MMQTIKDYIDSSPTLKMAIESITKNSFVQVLLIIIAGLTLVAIFPDKTQYTTIGVTLISAAVFKFLLTSNAFTIQMTKTIKPIVFDNFVSMSFLKSYDKTKLLEIIETSIKVFHELKYGNRHEKISNQIIELIKHNQGYIISADIKIEDTNQGNYIKSRVTKTYTVYVSEDGVFSGERRFATPKVPGLTPEEHFHYEKLIIDGHEQIPSLIYSTSTENGTDIVRATHEWPFMSAGEHKVEEIAESIDIEHIHVYSFSKPCFDFKVSFSHDESIIMPMIYTKYGRENPNKINGALEYKLENAIMFPKEQIFITFNVVTKEGI